MQLPSIPHIYFVVGSASEVNSRPSSCWILLIKHKNAFTSCVMAQNWVYAESWNPSSERTSTYTSQNYSTSWQVNSSHDFHTFSFKKKYLCRLEKGSHFVSASMWKVTRAWKSVYLLSVLACTHIFVIPFHIPYQTVFLLPHQSRVMHICITRQGHHWFS